MARPSACSSSSIGTSHPLLLLAPLFAIALLLVPSRACFVSGAPLPSSVAAGVADAALAGAGAAAAAFALGPHPSRPRTTAAAATAAAAGAYSPGEKSRRLPSLSGPLPQHKQRLYSSTRSGGEEEDGIVSTVDAGGGSGTSASSSSSSNDDESPPPFPSKTSLNAELVRLAKDGKTDEAYDLLNTAEVWYQKRQQQRRGGSAAASSRSNKGKGSRLTIVNAEDLDGDEAGLGVEFGPAPDASSYSTVIECLAKSESKSGGSSERRIDLERAQHLLDEMNRLSTPRPARKIKPNKSVYGVLMNAIAGSDDRRDDAVERCTSLLNEMSERSASKANPLCKPDTLIYNCLLKAIANSGRRDSGDKAEAVLDRMWDEHDTATRGGRGDGDGDESVVKPNGMSYVTVITAWARSNVGGKGARRGERLLERMEELSGAGDDDLRPNSYAVNAVLNAWAKSNERGSAARAEVILKRMEDLYLEGKGKREELRPTAVSYNTVISAYARSGDRGSERKAELLLRRMAELSTNETTREAFADCVPDTISYNTVINCWARSAIPYSARRAEAILRHMDRQFTAGKSSVAPDVTTYTSVLNAWSRSKENDAAHRADSILRRMEHVSSKDGGNNPRAKPNLLTYNAVLNCWAKCKDGCAADRAVQILDRLERLYEAGETNVKPDVFTYTSTIDALAKRDSIEAAEQASALLKKMEDIYDRTGDRDLKPNIRTYTSIINSISRSKQEPERALAVLNRMEHLFEGGDKDVQPDVVCYNAVINAFAWSSDPSKAIRGNELYKRMVELYESGRNTDAKPDQISINSLLSACAHTPLTDGVDNAEVVDIAIKTLEGVQAASPKFGRPNQITYATMLLAITNLLPAGDLRDNLAKSVFWQACQDGQVSTYVVSNLLNVATESTLKELLGDALTVGTYGPKYDFKRLPQEWTRYGHGRKSRPSRKKRPDQGMKRRISSSRR